MIERVSYGDREIILVGTAHVSEDSAREVEQVIEDENPDAVCVELDEKRYESLTEEDKWKDLKVKEALQDGKGGLLLMNILLSIYQKKLGDSLNIQPGSEMLAAIDAAEAAETDVHLIDRDIQNTIRDALQGLSIIEKLKLTSYGLYGFFFDTEVTEEQIEDMKESNIVDTMVQELGEEFPSLKENFLDKRDSYMASKIREIEADKIVAVVGAAHVAGIKEKLQQDTPVEEPEPVQKPRITLLKAAQYGIPLLIVGMFVYILFFVSIDAARNAFLFWVLVNGGMAAVGAIIARAHPVTILTASVTAPFASINPAVPTGLVAAYAENRLRPPTVGDLESISEAANYHAFWTNSALRLILVFFLVNLGSAAGTYLGAGYLAKVLAGA